MAVFASKSLWRRTGSVHDSRPAARSWFGDFSQKLHCVLRYVCGYEYVGSGALSHAHRSRSEEVVCTMPRTFLHRAKRRRRAVIAVNLFWSSVVLMLAMPCRSESAEDPAPQVPQTQLPAPEPSATQVATPQTGSSRWFNPATAPFLPIPEIAVDPDSGTTLGFLAVRLETDAHHEINRIIAPDFLHNPYFGYGAHARVYSYPSADEQWSAIAGVQQYVEREFLAGYEIGRLREQRWSLNSTLIYSRSGTPRFFGIGNQSPASAETNYTSATEQLQGQVGLNLNHAWQLLFTAREQLVDVLPGTLARIASLESRFGPILGVGANHDLLTRLSIVYDTRNDFTVPTQGMQWIAYAGLASRSGVFNDSQNSEAGLDGRFFWPVTARTVVAAHMALRYLPTEHRLPFWALSGLGGSESEIGGEQPLRGFGKGRYYDRDSFSTTVEVRRTVASFNAVSTHVDVEMAPFVDLGRVFAQSSTWPIAQLHRVFGLGFRGIARPFVVGYVDIGYGSEGVAAFTGINYPF
jgi:hypothetical protein